jgi:hypothetical protein
MRQHGSRPVALAAPAAIAALLFVVAAGAVEGAGRGRLTATAAAPAADLPSLPLLVPTLPQPTLPRLPTLPPVPTVKPTPIPTLPLPTETPPRPTATPRPSIANPDTTATPVPAKSAGPWGSGAVGSAGPVGAGGSAGPGSSAVVVPVGFVSDPSAQPEEPSAGGITTGNLAIDLPTVAVGVPLLLVVGVILSHILGVTTWLPAIRRQLGMRGLPRPRR